jgi:hypothetical protein
MEILFGQIGITSYPLSKEVSSTTLARQDKNSHIGLFMRDVVDYRDLLPLLFFHHQKTEGRETARINNQSKYFTDAYPQFLF